MRKIFVSEMVSVDGFFAGPGGEIDWHNVDAEFNEYAGEMLDSVDLLMFGRVTYELMAGYWPGPEGLRDDPLIAARMNALPKLVFSRTLDRVAWENARLAPDVPAGEMRELKKRPGKDIAILGSGTIVSRFAQMGLIDEYRLMVNPVVLGEGKPLIRGLGQRLPLRLLRTRTFGNGNVLLCYGPVEN